MMTEPTKPKFSEDVEDVNDQSGRPQTVSLSKLRQLDNKSKAEIENDSDQSIGEAFFPTSAKKESPEQTDVEKANSTAELKPEKQNGGLIKEGEQAITNLNKAGIASPQLRPKTVTTNSSDERKQQLVDMGAVSCKDALVAIAPDADVNTLEGAQTKRILSLKPKVDKCYICGKEFLLSSLKIHEKQCAKKFQRENDKQGQSGRATPSSEKSESKLNQGRNSPASTNSHVSKIPRKLKLEACYLCGREFFAHSLGVHETQCIKNWKASKTPEAKPGNVAEPRTADHCVHCEGTIPPGTEVFHKQKKCAKENGKGGPERGVLNEAKGSPKIKKTTGAETTGTTRAKGLKTTPCYMCGVQLLSHSLKVHEKKCQLNRKKIEGDSVFEELKGDPCSAVVDHLLSNDILTRSPPMTPVLENSLQPTDKNQEGCEDDNESLSKTAKAVDIPSESTPHRIPKKPRTVVCYICGQEFLKSSCAVHEKQCASRNRQTEQAETEETSQKVSQTTPATKPDELPEKEGTPSAPRKPKTQKCFVCGKDMLLSSLRIHEQQCQKKAEILKNINQQKGALKSQQRGSRPAGGAKPKTQVCYVCGDAFLVSSIKVHEFQCEKRWNAKNN